MSESKSNGSAHLARSAIERGSKTWDRQPQNSQEGIAKGTRTPLSTPPDATCQIPQLKEVSLGAITELENLERTTGLELVDKISKYPSYALGCYEAR
jgi:hypothetical protein